MIVVILCVLLNGCGSHVKPQEVSIQENLLTPCSSDTPIPNGKTGSDVLQALQDWQTDYNTCAAGKDRLIEAVRK